MLADAFLGPHGMAKMQKYGNVACSIEASFAPASPRAGLSPPSVVAGPGTVWRTRFPPCQLLSPCCRLPPAAPPTVKMKRALHSHMPAAPQTKTGAGRGHHCRPNVVTVRC